MSAYYKYQQQDEDAQARMFVLYGQIGARLRELGHETGLRYKVDDEWSPFSITIDNPSYRYANSNLKLRVQVGDYQGRKQFPQRRDGFDVDKIAAAISEEVRRQAEQTRCTQQCRANDKKHTAILLKVAKEMGLDADLGAVFGDLSIKASASGIQVMLTVRDIKDEAKLRSVLTALQATGLVKE